MITGDEPINPINEHDKTKLEQDNGCSYTGLTIRQKFTIEAMSALASNSKWEEDVKNINRNDWSSYLHRLSRSAVQLADSTIKALNETSNPN